MAKILVDDMTGAPTSDKMPVLTRTFAIDGATYEIDLTDASLAKLTEHMSAYVAKAQPVQVKTGSKPRAATSGSSGDSKSARTWATATPAGKAWAAEFAKDHPAFSVNAKGRAPAEMIAAWRASIAAK